MNIDPTNLSIPKGWSPERTATAVQEEKGHYKDCPTCWGQGRIIQNAELFFCKTCVGIGQVLVFSWVLEQND